MMAKSIMTRNERRKHTTLSYSCHDAKHHGVSVWHPDETPGILVQCLEDENVFLRDPYNFATFHREDSRWTLSNSFLKSTEFTNRGSGTLNFVYYYSCCVVCRSVHCMTCCCGSLPVFTALHGMQTRSCDKNSVRLSVRQSVCLSVCPSDAWIVTNDWVRLNVPPTHYRSYGDGFLRVKWPNQQCQSTEGR